MSNETAEAQVERLVRSILAPLPVGSAIEKSKSLEDLMLGFEYYLPPLLDKQGFHDGSDGMLMNVGRKDGMRSAQFVGICILMSCQRTTPFHVSLQIEPNVDELTWLEFRLGEKKGDQMKTQPYETPWRWEKLSGVLDDVQSVDWYYAAGFGEKRAEGPELRA